ncbi:MAG: PEGA domain-containing protein [Verrucomicrobia bacterium]|nr:PEGA domain-containing protein [Verrucomicrobiota bacterium]
MSEDFAQLGVESTRKRLSRAFRPLTYWVLISFALLIWDYHRKHAPITTLRFDVRIEGKSAQPSVYTATLGKWRVEPGSVAPIGWRKLRVSIPDAGIFEKRLFVWYGENIVGNIALEWKRGILDLKVEPKARLVRLIGPHHSFSLTNSSGANVSVPVGSYHVMTIFDHLSEQHQVEVSPNETKSFALKANLGSVNITSEPSGAKFRLSTSGRNPFNADGDTPALLMGLPLGSYQLRAWRDDYVREISLDVKKWQTNEVHVAFEYGEVKLTSEPDGAAIYSGNRRLGQTPATLSELKLGPQRFRLEKVGYAPTEVNVELLGTNLVVVNTNLVSLRYIEGMATARRDLGSNSPDYRKAMAGVEQALSEKPNDAEAVALKSQIEPGFASQVEKEAQQAQVAALVGRKHSAKQVFDKTISSIPQTELFDAHLWEFQTSLPTIRDALLRAVTKTLVKWNVTKEVRANDETLIFYGTSKGLLSSGKQFVILASQVDSNLVHVHAKFWDYTMATSRAIPPYQGKIDVPLNPKFFIPEEAANIEARRREIPTNVRSVLQKELQ